VPESACLSAAKKIDDGCIASHSGELARTAAKSKTRDREVTAKSMVQCASSSADDPKADLSGTMEKGPQYPKSNGKTGTLLMHEEANPAPASELRREPYNPAPAWMGVQDVEIRVMPYPRFRLVVSIGKQSLQQIERGFKIAKF
jgi:hypothetical protein